MKRLFEINSFEDIKKLARREGISQNRQYTIFYEGKFGSCCLSPVQYKEAVKNGELPQLDNIKDIFVGRLGYEKSHIHISYIRSRS